MYFWYNGYPIVINRKLDKDMAFFVGDMPDETMVSTFDSSEGLHMTVALNKARLLFFQHVIWFDGRGESILTCLPGSYYFRPLSGISPRVFVRGPAGLSQGSESKDNRLRSHAISILDPTDMGPGTAKAFS